MLKLLKILLGLCDHKWKIIGTGGIKYEGEKVGTYFNLQCEKCGNVKIQNLTS